MKKVIVVLLVLFLIVAGIVIARRSSQPQIGQVKDEALANGRAAESFPAADEDYFHAMDGGLTLSSAEVKGRNSWIVWSGGNDAMWDTLSVTSFGALDFLKTISSHPSLKASRDRRWEYYGLVNEPCFVKPTGPDPRRFGLWLDQRRPDCPPDPFENEQKYPGVRLGARGKNLPVGSYYGYATGIVGLRLFPNPAFDESAASKWDANRYYTDRAYYENKDLIKPYRVGMTCGFCHVGPIPSNPPADPNNPQWANLSSNVGAQYFWVDRIFDWNSDESSFVWQLFHTSRPGALDTSLISSDNINNPRTMNAVYHLGPRVFHAKRWGKEELAGGETDNRQFNDYVSSGPMTQFFQKPGTAWVPRVLKDGADSVGALGALNRVYLNIGTFSEEWLLHFNPLVGGKRITPIEIRVARQNSAYFKATEAQTFDMAQFFLKTTGPHYLKDAPGGDKYLTQDAAMMTRGKVVFAETCARCHSSKLPKPAPGLDPDGCNGKEYLGCWNKYWAWTQTDDFRKQMRAIVMADDFLVDNYLSADFRVPVTLLHTNACSPLATNALGGNIWDNFSSHSYKDLPSAGEITWYHPVSGAPKRFALPAGGRGYTRPPSLISLWSTAPFLLNNTVGRFEESGSVEARMRSFQDSIEKMLWPENRERDAVLGNKVPGMMDRTTQQSYLRVSAGYLPTHLQSMLGFGQRFVPWLVGSGGIEIGPIPAGTAVNLLANLNVLSESSDLSERASHDAKILALLIRIKADLRNLPRGASDEEARKVLGNLVDPLLELSKCPDFVVNRGHYFGTGYVEPGDGNPLREPALSDSDKRALIEFLKTF
jgi:cytochrome c5